MRIIKRGNLNKQIKFECQDCGSIFIAEKGEWRIPGRLDDENADYACECPICKRIVYAKEDHLQSYNDLINI